VEKLERLHTKEGIWIILPSFENENEEKMVIRPDGKRITLEEFNKLDLKGETITI
jgi:hypothetical protein